MSALQRVPLGSAAVCQRDVPPGAGRVPATSAEPLTLRVPLSPAENHPGFPHRPSAKLSFIDHVVGNQPDLQMVPVAEW